MIYRKSKKEDVASLYELMCILENKTLPYDVFLEIYEEQLASKNSYCLVAEKENKMVAMLNMRFERQLHHCEKIAEVMEFVVLEKERNLGIGKAMFQKACDIAKENGCPQIELATNQLRLHAHRFYEREGMSNFHYKFSMRLDDKQFADNKIGN